jgi:arsenate reductase
MAEGYLRHVAGDKYEVLSAGINPKGLNPLAIEAMREIGIDISGHRPKDAAEFLGTSMQYVVTVCNKAKEHCPIFPSAYKYVHWGLEDPAAASGSREERLAVFRRVRDELLRRIDLEFAGKPNSTNA